MKIALAQMRMTGNVQENLEKSLKFYKDTLNLEPVREKEAADGSFKLVYLGDGTSDFTLELTWLRDRTEPYLSLIHI